MIDIYNFTLKGRFDVNIDACFVNSKHSSCDLKIAHDRRVCGIISVTEVLKLLKSIIWKTISTNKTTLD